MAKRWKKPTPVIFTRNGCAITSLRSWTPFPWRVYSRAIRHRSCLERISTKAAPAATRTAGITDMMTWANICFQGSQPRINYAMDFTYSMEFGDYRPFGRKMVARSYTTYTDDNGKVIGNLKKLEALRFLPARIYSLFRTPRPPVSRLRPRVCLYGDERLLA